MLPRLLLDTHIVVRWMVEARKLSREQSSVLEMAVRRSEPLALSAITLLEIAILAGDGRLKLKSSLEDFFDGIEGSPAFRIFPLTYQVATEAAKLGTLRDPADRTIVATARVHGLRLATSDQRIIESGLVQVIE